jgi:hypothetical protein
MLFPSPFCHVVSQPSIDLSRLASIKALTVGFLRWLGTGRIISITRVKIGAIKCCTVSPAIKHRRFVLT